MHRQYSNLFQLNFVSGTDTLFLARTKLFKKKILPLKMSKRIKIEDQGIAEQLLATFGYGLINGIIRMKVNTDTDPNTGKNRSSPIFRCSSEFRYSSCSLKTTHSSK